MIEFLIIGFFVIAALFLYFLPTVNAARRDNPSTGWIFLFNLLFGMTLIGWFFALWWSETDRGSIANFVGRSVMYLITAGLLLLIGLAFFAPDTQTETKKPPVVKKQQKMIPEPVPAPQLEDKTPSPKPETTRI